MTLFERVFEHLLPRAKVFAFGWADSYTRKFFEGLSGLPTTARAFFDTVLDTWRPAFTTQLPLWENQFALSDSGLSEGDRRLRLDAAWAASGGQSPRYLQDSMQAAGFDVYIHPWWEVPVSGSPVARDPRTWLTDSEGPVMAWACEDDASTDARCGEDGSNLAGPYANLAVECGQIFTPIGYVLVNKIRTVTTVTLGCGDPELECSDRGVDEDPIPNFAFCAQPLSIDAGEVSYPIPDDPDRWRHFLYFGGQTFPSQATVSALRKNEFEDLLLKLCPGQLWLGVLVNYV